MDEKATEESLRARESIAMALHQQKLCTEIRIVEIRILQIFVGEE